MNTELVFADELPEEGPGDARRQRALAPWVVMIVDDDPAVHQVTQLVMDDFEFAGRRLQFLNAYTASEARDLLQSRHDVALVLLDVVMESEHAGLDLARFIREDIGNRHVRIVLRTGQPGQAPEEDVIKSYDINDYKEKTELTKRKLITVFYSALRSYRDIVTLELARQGLRRSIEAITQIHDAGNLRHLASALLAQLAHLLGHEAEGLCASRMAAYAASHGEGAYRVLAATAQFQGLLDESAVRDLPLDVREALEQVLQTRQSRLDGECFVGYYRTHSGNESLLYMRFAQPIDADGQELLQIFCANVAIAYERLLAAQMQGHGPA
ncbi:DUF3369 domain-containing protein [Roseateles sp. SL47]|uniref:DUF3369 domain-containing protein n=1 Tax=Roseateles sp. SL47 TaxID=2995138 RepID=UPI0022722A52|nr:DUF3369 domain-containing protein [Roseateles sp. SL47]WAC74847.1 DUF3369 domain-containing protein [Roseateles sp. SL47]